MDSPNSELTQALLDAIRALGATDDRDGTMCTSTTMLRYACIQTTWATLRSWDDIIDCAQTLLDLGLVTAVDDTDIGAAPQVSIGSRN